VTFNLKGTMMEMESLGGKVVRAVDVGYGNIKYSISHPNAFGPIECGMFPSRSPVASDKGLSAGFAQRKDTTIVEVNGTAYEVGKDVAQAQGTYDTSSVLDNDFCLSDAYMARFLGALHYMTRTDKRGTPMVKDNHIDLLMAGLPVSNFCNKSLREGLKKKLTGSHQLANGRAVTVADVVVLPQPLGGFFEYAFENNMFDTMKKQNNLIIDPGFFTCDWLNSKGLIINEERSDSVPRGMNAVFQGMVEAMKKKFGWKTDSSILLKLLDEHFRDGTPFIVFQKEYDPKDFLDAGRSIINDAVTALVNSVGDGADINNIVMVGGGAKFYLSAVQERFPHHTILVMDNPVYSNTRGFQLAGERQLISANRRASASK